MIPKFSVWDKVDKVYDVPIQIDIDDSGHISCVDTYHGSLVDGDFVLEQYTGLKDVNGKKIFEGDIVISGWNEMQEGGPDLYIEAKGQVTFDEGCFGVYDNEQGFRPLFTMTLNKLHVVGNIHKNPELLEVEE